MITLDTQLPSSIGPFYIYNNVWAAPSPSGYGSIGPGPGGTWAAGSIVENNIFVNVINSMPNAPGVTVDYNAYNYTSLGGYPWNGCGQGGYCAEPHAIAFTGNPFVNVPPSTGTNQSSYGDFHLAASGFPTTFQHGRSLAGVPNMDPDGNTYGSGGHWYVGAYQFVAEHTPTRPSGARGAPVSAVPPAPIGLHIGPTP